MTERICPECNNHLSDNDSYFCSSCGKKLPKELISTKNPIRVRTYSPAEPAVAKGTQKRRIVRLFKSKTAWSLVGLLVFILIVLVGIASSGVFELIGLKLRAEPPEELNLPMTKVEEIDTLSLKLGITEGAFKQVDMTSYVPESVDFYFEGANLNGTLNFSPFEVEDEDFTPKALLLLEPYFAGFAYDVGDVNRWGYLFVPKDSEIAEDVFGEGWGDYWIVSFLDNYMLVSNNEDVAELVKSVSEGVEKSLSQNPEYVRMVSKLSPQGQLQLFFMTEEARDIVRNSMGGLSQQTITLINMVLANESNAIVISDSNGTN